MRKKDLIEALVNHYSGGNKAKFAVMVGVKQQTINTWIGRDTFDVELLYSKCEGISGDWLLSGGKGEMLRSAKVISADNGSIAAGGDVHGGTSMGVGSTRNNYTGCNDGEQSEIVRTLVERVSTLTRELKTSQEQNSRLIEIIDKLINR